MFVNLALRKRDTGAQLDGYSCSGASPPTSGQLNAYACSGVSPPTSKSGLYASYDSTIEELVSSSRLTVQVLDNSIKVYLDGTEKKQSTTSTGYFCITVGNWRKGRQQKLAVHRIVYRACIGALDPNKVINHIDGNPKNNHPSNLELVSQSENNTHRFRVLKRPAVKGNASISQDIAAQIRADRAYGFTYRELIRKYGLCKSSISYIVNRKTWK